MPAEMPGTAGRCQQKCWAIRTRPARCLHPAGLKTALRLDSRHPGLGRQPGAPERGDVRNPRCAPSSRISSKDTNSLLGWAAPGWLRCTKERQSGILGGAYRRSITGARAGHNLGPLLAGSSRPRAHLCSFLKSAKSTGHHSHHHHHRRLPGLTF